MLERCPLPPHAAVAEIGCGTGRLLRELKRMAPIARAVGVDPEPAMLAQAPDLDLRLGSAESLPLEDRSLDLAYLSLAFHLVADREAAAGELLRVLRPGGFAAIWTLTPEHVLGFHLNPWFPSLPAVDLPRFQPPEAWMRLLLGAGFRSAAEQQLVTVRRTTAARLAAAVRARFISTLGLLPPEELEAGTRALEAEARRAPRRRVRYRQVWCLVWARR
jgi:ubiquinone/menaquinone biosynthesis C-methylase UbiE